MDWIDEAGDLACERIAAWEASKKHLKLNRQIIGLGTLRKVVKLDFSQLQKRP